jgi:PAS domain S-box-containing protein
VTERQRALERSRESEERFRQLAENIGEVFWILDARNTEMLYVSPAYERIWGRSCDSLYASPRSWADAIHPEDRDRILAAEADPRSRQMHDHIYRIVRPDGAIRWIRDRAFPVKNEAGEVFRVTGLAEDITEDKLAEESLHQLSIRLLQAQDEERQRIACELHDSTAQKLAALKMNLGRLEEEMPRLSGMMKKVLGDSFDIAEACSQEIRTISYLLHPPLLDELGLAVALRAYATGFSKRSGIQVSLKLPRKKERLPPETELTLFRVVQESLGNIHRHSGSKTASIRLARAASRAVLEVRDCGRGFPPVELDAVEKGKALPSVGIAGMQQRLRQVGGQLEILSGKTGTTVRAIVPTPGEKS